MPFLIECVQSLHSRTGTAKNHRKRLEWGETPCYGVGILVIRIELLAFGSADQKVVSGVALALQA